MGGDYCGENLNQTLLNIDQFVIHIRIKTGNPYGR